MSLARDFAQFSDVVNGELDDLVNRMAEAEKGVESSKKLDELIFERLGSIVGKLEGLAKLEQDVSTVKRLVTSIHDGHVHDMRDVRKRLGVLEAKAVNVTHPDEEVTPPTARPALPRREDPRSG
jgi:hypothetical protein